MKNGIFKYQAGGSYQQAAKELKQLGLLDKFKKLDKQDTGFKLSQVSPELAKKYGDLQYHGKPNQGMADKIKETRKETNPKTFPGDLFFPEQGIAKSSKTGEYYSPNGGTPLSQKRLNAFGLTPDSLAKIQPKEEVKTPVVDKPIIKTPVTSGSAGYSNKPVVSGGTGYNQDSKNPFGKTTITNEEFKKKAELQRGIEALKRIKEKNKDYYESLEKETQKKPLGGKAKWFFKQGGIQIKPENRGKFNATKERTGKSTEELTHSKNPVTKKRAVFAQNVSKWSKKKEGGLLAYKKGGYLKDKNTYVTKEGKETKRGLWANVYLKKKK